MTELSPGTHLTNFNHSFEKKSTTVGQILPHTVSKIIDEEGNILSRNVKGEIYLKGFGLFIGYYENENATKEAIDSHGFIKTGDIGYVDGEGYLYIEGRKKDVIMIKGENLSAKEIEEYLRFHPIIEDVQVIAVKDNKYGNEICSGIKLKNGKTRSN